MKTYQNTIQDFTKDLASSSPAPGGGAVAALAGSLAASLTSMVINLTTNKKKFMEYDDEIKKKFNDYLAKCDELRMDFLEDIDRDIEAFNEVMAAYKLPKDTDEEKSQRHKAIQRAMVEAFRVPYSVADKAYSMFDIVEFVAEYGNQNAITDAGVAAIQILAAIEAAILNVRINLSSIDDLDLVSEVDLNCKRLLMEATHRKEEVLKKVYKKI